MILQPRCGCPESPMTSLMIPFSSHGHPWRMPGLIFWKTRVVNAIDKASGARCDRLSDAWKPPVTMAGKPGIVFQASSHQLDGVRVYTQWKSSFRVRR